MKGKSETVREIAAKYDSVESRLYGSKFVVVEIDTGCMTLIDRETDTALIITADKETGLNISVVIAD